MAHSSEASYRLPNFSQQRFTNKAGETLTAQEIEADEVGEFLRSIVGAHAVNGFGKELATRVYTPDDPAKQKAIAASIKKRRDGGIGPRRIAVRNQAGTIAHALVDGVAMYDDINPLITSAWQRKARRLSAHLPGFHALSVWPADASDGAYYRMEAATHPEYRRTGVSLHMAFFALDSIMKTRATQQPHPLVEAPALSFVASDTSEYSLHSYPFLMSLGFIETGRTASFTEDIEVREMRAPRTFDVHASLRERLMQT
ncbi:MAG TPA: hypothetical protein VFZ58_06010 [Candidatus Saccharimonadales bacterium]